MTGGALLLLAALLVEAPAADAEASPRVGSVRVEIVGRGAAQAARLMQYVELAPGQRLDPAVVRHAVELMHATGEFEDVVAETTGPASALDLVFRAWPAPLLDRVVIEGDAVVSAAAAARIVRLHPREPLWPQRLDAVARDLALALAADGWLEARVTASARRSAQGADAVLGVQAGPRVRVRRSRVEQAPARLARELVALARPAAGAVFRRAEARAAAERMRSVLRAHGFARAAVIPAETFDPARGTVDVAFEVDAGPLMRVVIGGAAVPAGVAERVALLLREGRFEPDVVEEAGESIEAHFRGEGRRDVVVAHEVTTGTTDTVLHYRVTPGPVFSVASVDVLGFPGDRMPVLGTQAAEPLEDVVIAADEAAIVRALQEQGYADPQVEATVAAGGGPTPVVFRVKPGARTTVAALEIVAPSRLARGGEGRELRLRAGEPYRIADVAHDRATLLAAWQAGGYPDAEVTPEIGFAPDRATARVVLRVEPGPLVKVDHLVVTGLSSLRETVIRRELRLEEGAPLSFERLVESQRRVGALDVVQRVTIAEMDPESTGARTLVIRVEEAPRTTLSYGLGYAERDLLRASAEVTRRGLLGMDRSLSTFARISFRGSRFLATFREPYLLGRQQELFLTAFREEEQRETFDFVRHGGVAQTARALGPKLSLILRYTYQRTRSFNVADPDAIDRAFSTAVLSGPSASVVRDTRDDPLDPRHGRFLSADLLLSHGVLGGASFGKAFVEASTYGTLASHVVLAMSTRLGFARTLGFDEPLLLPRPDRFYAGGDYSLRGFAVDAVNPRGGNALVLGGAELRADVGRYLQAATFLDVGNVYPLVSNVSLRDLRVVAGLGLRYRSALGPLRVDWGYKLDREPHEKPYRLHFTVGHAF